ncbi:MAG: DegT/DnrJ/EryC1/StrS family aminotransferase [Planctomycetota bacterium]|nr:DegT/DnrJ/EryC1/StrS family aminotransferase [Planctomycetota bacterium]
MSNAIPLAKPSLSEVERQAVLDVLRSPVLASGPRVEQFAKSVAELSQRNSGIPCSSGTAGLTLVLAALGIGAGDKVVVPAFGFVAMANAVWSLGATPLFADCDPRTLNVDLNSVAKLLELKPRAVLAAETFGNPAGMPELEALCAAHEIPLVEDACEGIGGRISGRPVGGFGRASVFGFYPNKQITTGEGGVIVTDDTRLAERCRSLANHGRGEDGSTFVRPGWNFRLDEMSGALGNAQLSRLDEILDQREAVAAQYTARLSGNIELVLPSVEKASRPSWFAYCVRLTGRWNATVRDEVIQAMAGHEISCAKYFPSIPQTPAWQGRCEPNANNTPVANSISGRTIALPFYAGLSSQEIDLVCQSLELMIERATFRHRASPTDQVDGIEPS